MDISMNIDSDISKNHSVIDISKNLNVVDISKNHSVVDISKNLNVVDISKNHSTSCDVATMLKQNIDDFFRNINDGKTDTDNKTDNKKTSLLNDPVIKNIKVNFIFYLSILICIYLICKKENKNVICGIYSFIFVSMSGYFVHIISHFTNYTKIFDSLDNYITRNKFSRFIIRNTCKLVDFHDVIHHDTSINKKFKNVVIEFILNFITQSGGLLIIMFISRKMSFWVVALWGLLYSTIHIINYEFFVKSKPHTYHHINKHTNYGLDIWDVIFNTKYKNDNYDTENINHGAINVFILTGIIIYLMNRFK